MSQEEQALKSNDLPPDPTDPLTRAPVAGPEVEPVQTAPKPAGMFRRVAALVYDVLLVVALLFVVSVPFLPFADGKPLVPSEVGALAYFYRLCLVAVMVLFFGFFWTRQGQTLGMQAWRLRVEDSNGRLLGWSRALFRQGIAILPWIPALLVLAYADRLQSEGLRWIGEGLLMLGLIDWSAMWFDPQRRALHDRCSGSRVMLMPRAKASRTEW